jgi:Holliday junction resolvase RusA-like endonuclease
MRAMRTKRGGVVVFHANAERLAEYRATVGRIVAELWDGRPALDFPIALSADFYLARPLDHYEARNPNRPVRPGREALRPTRPDLDKAARALGDALVTAGLLADDALIAELHLTKRYGPPRTGVLIRWPL